MTRRLAHGGTIDRTKPLRFTFDAAQYVGFAGDTFNTLWALRALSPGHHIDYISAFGDDPFSEAQIEYFREHGIGIGRSPVIPGAHPGVYAITLRGVERSFTYWRGDAAARHLTSDPARLAKSLENRALIYFSGITLAILNADARQTLLKAIAAQRAQLLVLRQQKAYQQEADAMVALVHGLERSWDEETT